MNVILCLIILTLFIGILFLTKTILKQKKLIFSYDNNLKNQGYVEKLMFLANLAKTCGHDIKIQYSTINDYFYVLFFENGWDSIKLATSFVVIDDDESFEAAIENLERLIK